MYLLKVTKICANSFSSTPFILYECRLLVNLTQSPEICFQKVPEDKMFRNYFLEVLSQLQSYKEAFADEEVMGILARKLKKLLDLVQCSDPQCCR